MACIYMHIIQTIDTLYCSNVDNMTLTYDILTYLPIQDWFCIIIHLHYVTSSYLPLILILCSICMIYLWSHQVSLDHAYIKLDCDVISAVVIEQQRGNIYVYYISNSRPLHVLHSIPGQVNWLKDLFSFYFLLILVHK